MGEGNETNRGSASAGAELSLFCFCSGSEPFDARMDPTERCSFARTPVEENRSVRETPANSIVSAPQDS